MELLTAGSEGGFQWILKFFIYKAMDFEAPATLS